MKKLSLIILCASFLVACGGEGDKAAAGEKKDDSATANSGPSLPPGITQADYDKGLNLVVSSDCTTCHQVNEKLNGPAYAEVAQKYEPTPENIKMLAGKIIKGGSGTWGTVPMTPHADVSQEDAETMVKYVLALKNAK